MIPHAICLNMVTLGPLDPQCYLMTSSFRSVDDYWALHSQRSRFKHRHPLLRGKEGRYRAISSEGQYRPLHQCNGFKYFHRHPTRGSGM